MNRAGNTGSGMSEVWTQLSRSAFIADVGPRERSLGRFIGTLAAGISAYFILSIVVVLAAIFALVAFAHWPAPTSPAGGQALLHRFLDLVQSDKVSFGQTLEVLAIALPSNILPIWAFIGLALLIHQQRFKTFVTAAPRFRWRLSLIGLALFFAVFGPFFAVAQMMDPKAAIPPLLAISTDNVQRAIYGVICVVAFSLAALGEEVLFRGWMLRQLSVISNNAAVLMVVNGALFSAAHLQFQPDAFLERWILGAGLTYMTLRTGGVELSSGVHTGNNLMIVLFLEPLTLKTPPDTGLDAGAIVPFVGVFFGLLAIAEVTVRWGALRRWSGADQTAPPSPPTAIAAAAPWS